MVAMAGRSREEKSRYWVLVRQKVYADLRTESARTYAGFLWWIIDPLASMLVYFFVFGIVFERRIENFVQFLLIGIVLWRWFLTTVSHGAQSILKAKSLMRQVYVPKIVFPIVSILDDLFKFLIVLLILLVLLVMSGFVPGSAYLAVPFLLLTEGLLIVGLTLVLASVVPFVPDIRMVLDNVMRLWFFMSGIFYDVNVFPDDVEAVFRLNPMMQLIDWSRQALLYNQWPPVGALAVIAVVSVLLVVLGTLLITRHDYDYPKIAF